jgi:hypothetical protein
MIIGWLLRLIFPWKEIGWKEYGEVFYRYTVLKTPWFKIFLHQLTCPIWPDHCHDHPWKFLSLILWGGYEEFHLGKITFRPIGSLLYRPATFSHNVVTRGTCWSLVIVGSKSRNWKHDSCKEFSS